MKKNNEVGLPRQRRRVEAGFSLFEMLVVIAIFGILGTITTQIIMLSVRSAGKSESTIKVRENLNYAVAVMEREIRNAKADSVTCSSSSITYKNISGQSGSFSCSGGHIASGSARMIGDDINITNCAFACPLGPPPSVSISLKAKNTDKSGVESSGVDISTQIYLRNY